MKSENSTTDTTLLVTADDPLMTRDQFARELMYRMVMYFVKRMYREGGISCLDYEGWQSALVRICNPPIGRVGNPRRLPRRLARGTHSRRLRRATWSPGNCFKHASRRRAYFSLSSEEWQ